MSTLAWTLLVLQDLAGLAFGAWWLLRGNGRERAWTTDVARLTLLGLALGLVGLVGEPVTGSRFFTLRLWTHALICVLAPLALLVGLRRRGGAGLALVGLALCVEGVYLWARHVEPFRLEVRREEIASARLAGRPALRVAVLADLQTDSIGAWEARVFERLDAERADLVLIPGDLLQVPRAARERERAALAALFHGLAHRPRLGFVMVDGDCERTGWEFAEAGLVRLDDEALVFPDEGLQVIGLSCAAGRRPIPPALAAKARDFPGLTIFLAHPPEFALSADSLGVPVLCVAGHTHGGQVQLPFIGPLITLSDVPRAMAAGGLFAIGESWLCQSRGIGLERGYAPRVRFLCRPEIVVLELRAAAPPSPSDDRSAAASAGAPDRAATAR